MTRQSLRQIVLPNKTSTGKITNLCFLEIYTGCADKFARPASHTHRKICVPLGAKFHPIRSSVSESEATSNHGASGIRREQPRSFIVHPRTGCNMLGRKRATAEILKFKLSLLSPRTMSYAILHRFAGSTLRT